MPRKSGRNTKGRIVSAAWKLFYEQGYDNTTVEDIVFESETSKGSFYHYFEGKDALLGSLSMIFDEKYEELRQEMAPDMHAVEKLLYMNHELFTMIDNTVSVELLARLRLMILEERLGLPALLRACAADGGEGLFAAGGERQRGRRRYHGGVHYAARKMCGIAPICHDTS